MADEYKHGAYSVIDADPNKLAASAGAAYVYVGTAPVGRVAGGTKRVNTPVLIRNIAEAKNLLGYDDDWASYTLCEPMHVHLDLNAIGPLVCINVLDPAVHTGESVTTNLAFIKNKAYIPDENMTLDTLKLKRPFEDYTKKGFVKTVKDTETVFKNVGGKDVTGKVQDEQVFYYIFDRTPDKATDILCELEIDGHHYGCLDLGKNRASNVTILYFSLKLGDHDFIDGKPDKTVKDLSDFTGDITMTLYSCTGTDLTTYPVNLKVLDQTTMHFESGDSLQYYELGRDFSAKYSALHHGFDLVGTGGIMPKSVEASYDTFDPAKVTIPDVIGEDDGMGLYTGLHAIAAVYQATHMIPSFLCAPGFSSNIDVHNAMIDVSKKINKHWDAYVYADIPLIDAQNEDMPITMDSAASWKTSYGFNNADESVYFPMALGTDGRHYHLSVLAAANAQVLLRQNGGYPYMSASNTECSIIRSLWLGTENDGRVYDDTIVNEMLNRHGINSAVFMSGTWRIWGAHSADYEADEDTGDGVNIAISETNRQMLYHIGNDFQYRRASSVDKPLTANDLQSIVAEEQARLDALVQVGALTYGQVRINADEITMSDMYRGDYSFAFDITTTPLAKSLTALVSLTDEGFVTFYESLVDLSNGEQQ